MKLADICIITENVPLLASFYEKVLKVPSEGDAIHAALTIGNEGLAIYSKTNAEKDMNFDFSKYWGSGNFTIGFNVDNVDMEFERLKGLGVEFVTTPTSYPWGARSFHFRDPDGNIVCFRTLTR